MLRAIFCLVSYMVASKLLTGEILFLRQEIGVSRKSSLNLSSLVKISCFTKTAIIILVIYKHVNRLRMQYHWSVKNPRTIGYLVGYKAVIPQNTHAIS